MGKRNKFFSFDSVIRYLEVSKPSMYRLVGNEDNLKSKSLIMYYEKYLDKITMLLKMLQVYLKLLKKLDNIKNKKIVLMILILYFVIFKKLG